jgi:thiosulfate/3-mercaptopyruvate sulfurtransferase
MKAGCILSALFLPAALSAQVAGAREHPAPDDSLLVTSEWLASRLADSSLTIVQVERSAEMWASGRIPGAQTLALSAILTSHGRVSDELPTVEVLDSVLEMIGISNGRRIIIYGDPLAASRLFFTLDYLGLGERAAILDGGLAKWRAEGRPVTTDSTSSARGNIQPEVRPAILVDAAWLRDHIGDSMTVLLDARPIADYRGEAVREGIERPGHITGAVSFYWRESLARQNPPTLLDRPALQRIFDDAGLTARKQVVVYCQTGVRASWLYFVARYLGYAPRLYDPSYPDWSADPSLPIDGPAR